MKNEKQRLKVKYVKEALLLQGMSVRECAGPRIFQKINNYLRNREALQKEELHYFLAKCRADFSKLVTKFVQVRGVHTYMYILYTHTDVHTCLFHKQTLDIQLQKPT